MRMPMKDSWLFQSMIGMMVSLNNMLLIVQIQYIYYFGLVNGKQERSEMDFMVLALLLYR